MSAGTHRLSVPAEPRPLPAPARLVFSGVHTGTFLGRPPTMKPVAWDGAALFTFRRDRIAELWVLGDLAGLEAQLRANAVD